MSLPLRPLSASILTPPASLQSRSLLFLQRMCGHNANHSALLRDLFWFGCFKIYVFIRERGRDGERTSRGRAEGEGEHPRAHSRWARSPTPQPELKPRIRCLDDGATQGPLTGLLMGLLLNEREAGIVGPWAPGSCEGQCGHVPSAQGEAVLGVGWAPPVLGGRLLRPPVPSEGKVSGEGGGSHIFTWLHPRGQTVGVRLREGKPGPKIVAVLRGRAAGLAPGGLHAPAPARPAARPGGSARHCRVRLECSSQVTSWLTVFLLEDLNSNASLSRGPPDAPGPLPLSVSLPCFAFPCSTDHRLLPLLILPFSEPFPLP